MVVVVRQEGDGAGGRVEHAEAAAASCVRPDEQEQDEAAVGAHGRVARERGARAPRGALHDAAAGAGRVEDHDVRFLDEDAAHGHGDVRVRVAGAVGGHEARVGEEGAP